MTSGSCPASLSTRARLRPLIPPPTMSTRCPVGVLAVALLIMMSLRLLVMINFYKDRQPRSSVRATDIGRMDYPDRGRPTTWGWVMSLRATDLEPRCRAIRREQQPLGGT